MLEKIITELIEEEKRRVRAQVINEVFAHLATLSEKQVMEMIAERANQFSGNYLATFTKVPSAA